MAKNRVQTDGQTGRRTDGQTDGRTDGRIETIEDFFFQKYVLKNSYFKACSREKRFFKSDYRNIIKQIHELEVHFWWFS
jgi:hypothetical protein